MRRGAYHVVSMVLCTRHLPWSTLHVLSHEILGACHGITEGMRCVTPGMPVKRRSAQAGCSGVRSMGVGGAL